MSKSKLLELNGAFTVTHQAVCATCGFAGDERGKIEDAYTDARRHRREPGNALHSIRVDTTQTTSRMFIDSD